VAAGSAARVWIHHRGRPFPKIHFNIKWSVVMAKKSRARAPARQPKCMSKQKRSIETVELEVEASDLSAKTLAKRGRPPISFPSELLEECRRRYEETTATIEAIGLSCGMSDFIINRLAGENNWTRFCPQPVKRGPAKLCFTPALLEECRRRYEETPQSAETIGLFCGVSARKIESLARENNWTRFRPEPLDVPSSERLRQRAMALAEAAERNVNSQSTTCSGGETNGSNSRPLSVILRWPRKARPSKDDGHGHRSRIYPRPAAMFAGASRQQPTCDGRSSFEARDLRSLAPQDDGRESSLVAADTNEPETPTDTIAAGIAQVLAGVQQELATVRAIRARMTDEPQTILDAQRVAQTYASLTATLRDLQRAQSGPQPLQHSGYYDDDMPADIDEFRNELARRIRVFVAGRRARSNAQGDAAPPVAETGA
jgi:hypothetical protein